MHYPRDICVCVCVCVYIYIYIYIYILTYTHTIGYKCKNIQEAYVFVCVCQGNTIARD
jgi:hypothetical protein